MKQKIYTATQARQNFFELLKLVQSGEDAFVIKKDSGIHFKISLVPVATGKKNASSLSKRWSKIHINLKGTPWQTIKEIIESKHDIS